MARVAVLPPPRRTDVDEEIVVAVAHIHAGDIGRFATFRHWYYSISFLSYYDIILLEIVIGGTNA